MIRVPDFHDLNVFIQDGLTLWDIYTEHMVDNGVQLDMCEMNSKRYWAGPFGGAGQQVQDTTVIPQYESRVNLRPNCNETLKY